LTRANGPKSPRRKPGDSGVHPFPGAMRCGFEPGNHEPSCGMDGGMVVVPGVPGLPPGASWTGEGTEPLFTGRQNTIRSSIRAAAMLRCTSPRDINRRWMPVEKALHGLFPLDRPQATPRVSWVDGQRILRWMHVEKALHGLFPLDRPQATPRVSWVDGQRILRWMHVEKALHGLFPLDRPQATPRVSWVDGQRILRWQTSFTACWASRAVSADRRREPESPGRRPRPGWSPHRSEP